MAMPSSPPAREARGGESADAVSRAGGSGAFSAHALTHDAVLAPFFDDEGFSAHAYVRSILRQDNMSLTLDESVAEQALRRIRERSSALEQSIRTLVSTHQDELFATAGNTAALRKQMADVQDKVQHLGRTVESMHEDIVEPYLEMRKDAVLLRNTLSTTHVLLRTQRVLAAARKLYAALAGSYVTPTPRGVSDGPAFFGDATGRADAPLTDARTLAYMRERLEDARTLMRAAPIMRELAAGLADPSTQGIAAVDALRAWCDALLAAARSTGEKLTQAAVNTLNSADIGTGLQILHDLGALPEIVQDIMRRASTAAAQAWVEALDVRQVAAAASAAIEGGAGMSAASLAKPSSRSTSTAPIVPPAGAAAAWRGALWARVETVCEHTQRLLLQCWNLAFVLSHVRDTTGKHELASDLLSGTATVGITAASAAVGAQQHPCVALLNVFWQDLTRRLRVTVDEVMSSDAHAFVRQTLVEAYPRMHYLMLDIPARVAKSVSLRASSEDAAAAHRSFIVAMVSRPLPTILGTQLLQLSCTDDLLLWTAASMLRQYVARSFSRLSDAATAMFPAIDGAPITTSKPPAPSASVQVDAQGFTPASATERFMDEVYPDAPTLQATAHFVRIAQAELAACRPPSASTGAASSMGLSRATALPGAPGATPGSLLLSNVAADATLFAAISKNVATATKLIASRSESRGVMAPSAVAISRHATPTPAQTSNLALAARLDDVRRALLRCVDELPRSGAAASFYKTPQADAVETSSERPLAHPRSAALWSLLRAVTEPAEGTAAAAETTVGVEQTAHAHMLRAVDALDNVISALLTPWISCIVMPLERGLLRMHELTYTSDTGAAVGGPAAPPPESEYILQIDEYCSRISTMQLSLLPSGHLAEAVRGCLVSRTFSLFVRFACLLRPVDESGRMRIARDIAQLESAAAHIYHDVSRVGRAYTELRALRPFLFLPAATLLSALRGGGEATAPTADESGPRRAKVLALLRSLRAHNVMHALLARLPATCSMPSEAAGLSPGQYSDWLDAVAVNAERFALDARPSRVAEDATVGWRRLFVTDIHLRNIDARVHGLVRNALDAYAQRSIGGSSDAAGGTDAEALSHVLLMPL